ncbi:hypothetical protein Pmar_PMAR005873 [Perkinsus marinus ATCC 50983]|uniref:Uncharacterized protein n=1 Tax=Perkinsus marinus (strain ATCC 50983 / TXsc) TaxID=423536 RepID=C5KYG1_PERM5|nr:hypothetical protein Pmar_PMAR005873 [Perkinsus marinus ATCC 50983]EER10538.1 hypothetical protein Pmar_PMAR005873 [Perkinsus marinus ATCC 50983]|eukprot:XP_002778743.1 hypothetical protein Pmar_PMAR005873 [Perkinsus marinus ATCC 50983]
MHHHALWSGVRDTVRVAMVVDTVVDAMVIVLMIVMMIVMVAIVAIRVLVPLLMEGIVEVLRGTGGTPGIVPDLHMNVIVMMTVVAGVVPATIILVVDVTTAGVLHGMMTAVVIDKI